jgi:hypothetical protein
LSLRRESSAISIGMLTMYIHYPKYTSRRGPRTSAVWSWNARAAKSFQLHWSDRHRALLLRCSLKRTSWASHLGLSTQRYYALPMHAHLPHWYRLKTSHARDILMIPDAARSSAREPSCTKSGVPQCMHAQVATLKHQHGSDIRVCGTTATWSSGRRLSKNMQQRLKST